MIDSLGDLVVTVPKSSWKHWLKAGDVAGVPETGREWGFIVDGTMPQFIPGARLYIVSWDRLRGYAPIVRIDRLARGISIVRRGGSVACTRAASMNSFSGWRRRSWEREDEVPFPDWKTEGVLK